MFSNLTLRPLSPFLSARTPEGGVENYPPLLTHILLIATIQIWYVCVGLLFPSSNMPQKIICDQYGYRGNQFPDPCSASKCPEMPQSPKILNLTPLSTVEVRFWFYWILLLHWYISTYSKNLVALGALELFLERIFIFTLPYPTPGDRPLWFFTAWHMDLGWCFIRDYERKMIINSHKKN